MSRSLRRRLPLLLGAVLGTAASLTGGFLAAAQATTAGGGAVPGPVVLIGTAGLRWDDISDQTSSLDAVLSGGAVGSVVSRSIQLSACPIDGWLAVSAGRRADAARGPVSAGDTQGCRPPTATITTGGGSATVPDWAQYVQRARDGGFDAVPGTLGDALAAAGRTAVAIGPGATVALARSDGTVAHAWPGLAARPGGAIDPQAAADTLGDQLTAALASKPAVVVVDVGAVRDDAVLAAADSSPTPAPTARDRQVTALDDRLGVLFANLPENSTLVLASLADSGPHAHLQLAAASGPTGGGTSSGASSSATFGVGLLRSGSTRQDGLVQTTDILPTLLRALAVPVPSGIDGAPMTGVAHRADEAGRLQQMLDLDEGATTLDDLVTPFFAITLSVQLVLYAALAWFAHRLRLAPAAASATSPRRRVLAVLRHVAVVGACLPAATVLANLWPWWRSDHRLAVLLTAVVVAALPLAAVALLGPWRRSPLGPAAVAGALTAVVLTADVATGSQLSLTTLMGGQPLIGGRYFGFSNPSFALFGTGLLFAALGVAQLTQDRSATGPGRRRDAVIAVAAIGLVATVVDVLPGLGADFGGPPALVPAFALLALRIAGVRVTWARAALIAAGTVALLTVICVADWLRPADQRTHLGRFVQTVIDGGAWDVVRRKAEQNLSILVSGPLTLVLPLAALLVVWALARPARFRLHGLEVAYDRLPLLRTALAALGVMLALGFALNDSGTSIPPVAMVVALPLLVAICAHVLPQAETDELEAAVERTRLETRRGR